MSTAMLPNHFFISDTDGALHDTRHADWASIPLRTNYKRAHRQIETVTDMKATLRHGPYAWPGGYPLFFVTNDGGAICFACGRSEFRCIADSIRTECSDGWRVMGCDINYEDSSLYCDHCGKPIESAYGEEES
jgi:hypothetical protein